MGATKGDDVCTIGNIAVHFLRCDFNEIFHDLAVEFEKADLSIVNLECPFIGKSSPIKKTGAILGVESSCANGLVKSSSRYAVLVICSLY